MAVSVRAHLIAAGLVLSILIVPVPTLGQDSALLPAPSLPEGSGWAAQFQGVAYEVVGSVVKRVDGQKPDTHAAAQVLKAKRVHDLVSAHPDLVERLGERERAQAALAEHLDSAQAALAQLDSAVEAIDVAAAQGLLGDLLESLPVRPVDLVSDAAGVNAALDGAREDAESVQAVSRDARASIYAFEFSHAVEDKASLLDSFLAAVPVYEAAAERAELVKVRADRLALASASVADALGQRSLSLFGVAQAPSDLSGAVSAIQAVAAEAQSYSDGLRSDAAFMHGVASESSDGLVPIEWIVGGGAGAAAAGLSGLWWLRRRAGLP